MAFPTLANGQFNHQIRDSLTIVLSRPLSAQERLLPLKELAWSHFFSDKAYPYLDQLDSLTLLLIDDPVDTVRGKAASVRSAMFYQRGYLAKFHRNMVAAQRDLIEAERFAWKAKDTLAAANALSGLGVCYLALRMPERALHYFDEEMDLIRSMAVKPAMYTTHIHQHKADALMRLGRMEDARNELMQCDTMEAGRHALTYMGLGQLEAYRGDTASALTFMLGAERIAKRSAQQWDLITVLEPMARLQLQVGSYDNALATADKAIAVARSIDDEAALAGCLVIAGEALLRNGDARSAERAFEEALELARENGFIGLSRETGDDGSMIRAADQLKNLYKAQGRTADALAMTEQWADWKDQIHQIEGSEELLRSDLQRVQLKDSIADAGRIDDATHDLQATLRHERKQRKFIIAAGVAVLSLVLLGVFVLLNRRKQELLLARHELQRNEQARMIEDLRMRERMSEDLHEELGAGLSALKLWSDMDLTEETDPRKRQLLANRSAMADELVASLRQIIWAMNSPNGTVKNLVDYLNDSAHFYCAQHGIRLRVQVDQEWPTIPLSADQRRDPFLVVKEALANTVKHSGADMVDLRMQWRNGLHLEIQDNGKGLHGEMERLPGNGLRTMQRRITALGGRIHFDGAQGMRIEAFIPLRAAR